jgi:hypothetical protein
MKYVAQKPAKAYVEYSGAPPPHSVVVEHEHKAVLHLPDGKVLVRKAGF